MSSNQRRKVSVLTSARRVSETSAQRVEAAREEEGVSLVVGTDEKGGASNAQGCEDSEGPVGGASRGGRHRHGMGPLAAGENDV